MHHLLFIKLIQNRIDYYSLLRRLITNSKFECVLTTHILYTSVFVITIVITIFIYFESYICLYYIFHNVT